MPPRTKRQQRPKRASRRALARETWDLGQIPLLTLIAGIGVLICTAANLLERGTHSPPTIIYWFGLLVITVPIFIRLLSEEPGYRERLGLVVLFGIALFGVKIAHDSPMFIFPDEFAHSFNVNQIVNHHELFRYNPLLPITPHYPGLEGVTSALMSITGVSSFTAGTLVIGAARLMLVVGMFLLFARVSGSPRIAGIGVAVFAGSSNFLFWSAQFSYESLSLPLLIVVLLAFVEWDAAGPGRWRRGWSVFLVLLMAAIVVTHHLTAYATIIIFAVLALLYRLLRVKRPNPWRFAVIAAAMAGFWLLVAAGSTKSYLWPVLSDAFEGAFNTASGEAAPRTLFNGSSTDVGVTPMLPRAIALLAVLLLGLGMLYGLRAVWRRYRLQPLPLVLVLGSFGFFAALLLRFVPSAWETGNRAGGFFFIGLAFVVGHAIPQLLRPWKRLRLRRSHVYAGLTAALAVILLGGAISGWPWDAQLTPPLRASAEGHEIVSEPLALAEWVGRELPDERFGAPEADARLLMTPGEAIALAGESPDVKDIVRTPTLESWQLPLLKEQDIRYVVGDRRDVASDNVRGYFFHVPGEGNEALAEKGVITKFSRLPVARVFDSGRIVLFDLENKP